LKAAGIGAAGAAGLPLAAACGELDERGGTVQSTEAASKFVPVFKEFPLEVTPDLVGEPPQHPSGFLSYPEPKPAITEKPSNSGSYEVTVPMWGDPPPSNDPFFAAVHDAWGGTNIKLRQADGFVYPEATSQWIQANEFGDGIHLFSWMLYAHPNFTETVANRFYNLSEILAGKDISERWPLLAGLPSEAWGGSLWTIDPDDRDNTTGIYGVPGGYSGGAGNYVYARTDLLDEADLTMPQSIEELLDVARSWSDDRAGRWAFGGIDWFSPMWFNLSSGINHGWVWDGSKLVHNVERPEFSEWVEFRRTLNDERLQHPDVGTDGFDARSAHIAGDIVFCQDGAAGWVELPNGAATARVEIALDVLPPMGFDGRTPLVHENTGVEGWLFLNKDLDREQVEEILDCCNFCAAPYGTTEFELLEYGVEGTHFEINDDGVPEHTDEGAAVVSAPVNFYGFAGRTQTFLTGDPQVVQKRFDYNANARQYFEANLFQGLRIEVPEALGTADQILDDRVDDIVFGRAELSALPDAIERWKSTGGDASRAFFEDVYQSVNEE
jgi:putative aldouronate transport system substrate-binding protein